MSRPADVRAVLSAFGPPAGPCALCGLPDKRHRILEAVAENVRAGDSPAFVAEAYGAEWRCRDRDACDRRYAEQQAEVAAAEPMSPPGAPAPDAPVTTPQEEPTVPSWWQS